MKLSKLVKLVTFLFFISFNMSYASFKITQISIYRSEVQLQKLAPQDLKVGDKLKANSYTSHKCLLVVTRLSGQNVFTEASQCPGFGTLKKGDIAEKASPDEKNEEVVDSPTPISSNS